MRFNFDVNYFLFHRILASFADYRPSFFESIDLHRNVTYIRSRVVRTAEDQLVERIESERDWIARRNADIQKNILEKRQNNLFM